MERRLAAILAADVVGYSRLMGADEGGTLAALRALRAELFDPTIAAHHGRIVKLMGDGALVEFASVVDAVTCAAEVQKALAARNADMPEDQRLELRIGINLGDVMVEDDDLYGDGVNVAARLEGIADPGGICVSDAVVQQAQGKVGVSFEDLGEQSLKNIAEPVRVWRVVEGGTLAVPTHPKRPRSRRLAVGAVATVLVCTIVIAGWFVSRPSSATAISADKVLTIKGPAIAMLPFVNRSDDKAHDAFAVGMTDQIAAALIRFKGVRVLSRRASVKYSDDLPAMRNELGADYLLEGRVLRDAERIEITAILTKLESGAQVWTDTFKAPVTPTSIIDIEDRLAGTVAAALGTDDVGAINTDRVADQRTSAPEDQSSLDCVLSGGTFTSPKAILDSYKCLKEALREDPKYAHGWSRISTVYCNIYVWDLKISDNPDLDPLAECLKSARKAVSLSPKSAAAHNVLASALFFNGEHDAFLAEVAKTIELNPNDASTIAWKGTMIAFTGRWDEGVALVEKAAAFNPSVVAAYAWYGPAKAHFLKGEYEESLNDFRRVWTSYPNYWLNDLNAAYLYGAWGKQDEAAKAVALLLEKRPGYTIEDAVDFYRLWQFQDDFIDKMVTALKKAGLPSREA